MIESMVTSVIAALLEFVFFFLKHKLSLKHTTHKHADFFFIVLSVVSDRISTLDVI